MGRINLLPKSVYNKISAGEVVERPSSVVKELFENAVDAGATEITVTIKNGGVSFIAVTDNGCGMDKDDIVKAFYPHATSKIKLAEDLDDIETLGFRGEALASVSAVSKVTISTKTPDSEMGYELTCEGGEFGEIVFSPCLDGTTVTVEDLFYNTPARLKFLKSQKSEENDVSDTIDKLILANPGIAVKFYADDKLITQSYGGGKEDAALAVYGVETVEKCYLVSGAARGVKVEGFIGNTNFFKSTRTYQTIIVNGRVVSDKTVSQAIQNAYSSYVMKRQYPFYILYITVPGEILDVNVHPRKAEVRFSDNQVVYGAIYSIVSKVLDGSAQALDLVVRSPKSDAVAATVFDKSLSGKEGASSAPVDSFSLATDKRAKPYFLPEEDRYRKIGQKDFSKSAVDDYELPAPIKSVRSGVADRGSDVKDFAEGVYGGTADIDAIFKENKAYAEKLAKEKAEREQLEIETSPTVRYVGQVLATYLVLECGQEMILIDQHAAHERILFDSFYEKVKTNCVVKQSLLYPYSFRTNPKEFDLIYDRMQYFRKIGIDVEAADDNVFKVYSVPVELVDISYDDFFADILSDDGYKKETLPGVIVEKIMQKACKSAIKSGYELTRSEIDALLALLKDNWGLKCPHGRPVAVKISRTEIDKWFKRIV